MRVLLVGRHQSIEPLGIEALAGVARDAGWERDVVLVRDGQFQPVVDRFIETRPDVVAFSVWTGFHRQSFAAADTIRELGGKVAIGGPHATYFDQDCVKHADWISKGTGFRTFRRILEGVLEPGVRFDEDRLGDTFPVPDRAAIYDRYPDLAASDIKSMMASVGCPYTCSYCHSPQLNQMYGGFQLNLRSIDDLVREAIEIRDRWPAKLIYFQDDVMGFSIPWLEEFTHRWKAEVGLPWHCQIRLEMTREERRLDLFVEGGCTGITLAIESGNAFLRQYVLQRAMPDELIVDGIRKIQERGLALRTEQILAVPFSDLTTDLETLELNTRLNPEMAWTSILAPYGGTAMGTIASNFGMYAGNNDDLSETFFDRSVLRHVKTGWRSIETITRGATKSSKDNPLLRMSVLMRSKNSDAAVVGVNGGSHATLQYLSPEENDTYASQTVRLQQLFFWLAKVHRGHELAAKYLALPECQRTWEKLGELTALHLALLDLGPHMVRWLDDLRTEMGVAHLPEPIADNAWYFVFMPSGGEMALEWLRDGVLLAKDPFPQIGYRTRQWLFHRVLYRTIPALQPIAHSGQSAIVNCRVRSVSLPMKEA